MNNPDDSTNKSSSNLHTPSSNHTIKALNDITKILIIVSVLLVGVVPFLQLDFLDGTLLGVAIVGFNFYLTRRTLLNVFFSEGFKGRVIILYVLKLGISGLILFLAIVHFEFSRIGLLIGLSNIVIAIFIFSIKQALFSKAS